MSLMVSVGELADHGLVESGHHLDLHLVILAREQQLVQQPLLPRRRVGDHDLVHGVALGHLQDRLGGAQHLEAVGEGLLAGVVLHKPDHLAAVLGVIGDLLRQRHPALPRAHDQHIAQPAARGGPGQRGGRGLALLQGARAQGEQGARQQRRAGGEPLHLSHAYAESQ